MAIRFNWAREQEQYLAEKLGRLPRHWRARALDKFNATMKARGTHAANSYLRDLIEPLEGLLNIAGDDGDIQQLAKDTAFKVREKSSLMTADKVGFWLWAQEVCLAYSVRFPHEFDSGQQLARLIDDVWWLRNLRNAHARAREVAAINAGMVHRHGDLYVSDDTLERRGQQVRRNQKTLENITMQSESGQRMTLADIAKAGMANQANRRAELMTRIAGFEELSIKYGHKALFVTITCPSRMHAVLKNGKPNPKYDGTKPDEAQRYLVECWARARARLHFYGVKVYGLRVAEPHHDGCPHWHVILFYKPSDNTKGRLQDAIRLPFLQDSFSEEGAQKNRVKFVHINPLRGSAAGYVMKYVAKNIGGIEGENSDEANTPSEKAAARVEAWASTWRIRQFQQVGGHSVTVWRELRRVDESEAQRASLVIQKAWMTAQKIADKKASFGAFVESMGGLEISPRQSMVCAHDDYVTKRGRYGETVVRVVKGIAERFGISRAKNNREKWERV